MYFYLIIFFIRRLVSSLAMTRLDLERERQAAEDLRREMQSYISHVRQVETVLARKVSGDFVFFFFLNYILNLIIICGILGRRKGYNAKAVSATSQ